MLKQYMRAVNIRAAVGYGDSHGDSHGYGYGMGMGWVWGL